MTDEQLQSQTLLSNNEAEEELIQRYIRTVRTCSRPFFLAGGDSGDLTQEGMIGLLAAIRQYDSSKGVLFRTFAEACIRNRIQSAVRSAKRKKHAPLNDGVSLDNVLSDETQSRCVLYYQQSPEEQVLARETQEEFISVYSRCLSKFELRVVELYLSGLSRGEIADETGRSVKSVDNAISRIRRKLATLSSGDNSIGCSQY